MTIEAVTSSILSGIMGHVYKWLVNLSRAKPKRKKESINALRKLVIASRETNVYIRQLDDNGKRDHSAERRLSTKWTNLGYTLYDLGLNKLARRCEIKGKHWADPTHYDQEFLDKADVKLDRMERLAKEMLKEIGQ